MNHQRNHNNRFRQRNRSYRSQYDNRYNDSDIYENEFVNENRNHNNYDDDRSRSFLRHSGDRIRTPWRTIFNDSLDYENYGYDDDFTEYDNDDIYSAYDDNQPERDSDVDYRFRQRHLHNRGYNSENERNYAGYDRGRREFSHDRHRLHRRRRKSIHR